MLLSDQVLRRVAAAALVTALLPAVPAMGASAPTVPIAEEEPAVPIAPPTPAIMPALPLPSVLASRTETPLAPGVTYGQFERLYPGGWVRGYAIDVDLSNPAVYADMITAPAVTGAERLSLMARSAGAIAAVNGDFFDIANTKMPLGPVVRSGELLKTGPEGWAAVGVGADRIGRLLSVALEGSVLLPDGSVKLATLNQWSVTDGGVGAYTPLWTASRQGAAFGAALVREVVVQRGRVTQVATQVGSDPVPADGFVLVGREEGAERLASLQVGDPVYIGYAPRSEAVSALQFAVGGGAVLIRDGRVQAVDNRNAGPRTAVGFSADGRRMLLVAVDGRSEESGGLTLQQMAWLMQGMGAANALELDGGGSTTVVARTGEEGVALVNQPSDGAERRVPNGIGIFVLPGSGQAAGLSIQPKLAAAGAERVFPGLTRTLVARAYDERLTPVAAGSIAWSSATPETGTVLPSGQFYATAPGFATALASNGLVSGAYRLQVLGPLTRVKTDTAGLQLRLGESAHFTVVGCDADGYSAPIEPGDVVLSFNPLLMKVERESDGFRVTALADGTGYITLAVGGVRGVVPFAAGSRTVQVTGFEALDGWGFQKYPATVTGSLSLAPGRTGNGLLLTYDLGAGPTRAAYAEHKAGLELPGKPRRMGLWVKGDGQGAWLRARLTDAQGATYTVNLASAVTWTGWQYVEAELPAVAAYPLRLARIYPVETDTARVYGGELLFDDLQVSGALTPPELPWAPPARDPIQGGYQPGDAGRWPFAIVSGDGVTADRLRQATAGHPEFLVIAGTLSSADPERTVDDLLTGELRTTRHYYMPGENGQARGRSFSFDIHSTRFVLLDTGAAGSLRQAGFDQLLELQATLDAAAVDARVQNVVVMGRVRPDQFADPQEGALVQQWLSGFQVRTGKPVAYVATGGGTSDVLRVDGVPYVGSAAGAAPQFYGVATEPQAVGPWLITR